MHSAIIVSLVAMHGSILEKTMHTTKSVGMFQCAAPALDLRTVSSEGLTSVSSTPSDRESFYNGRSRHAGGRSASLEVHRANPGIGFVFLEE